MSHSGENQNQKAHFINLPRSLWCYFLAIAVRHQRWKKRVGVAKNKTKEGLPYLEIFLHIQKILIHVLVITKPLTLPVREFFQNLARVSCFFALTITPREN